MISSLQRFYWALLALTLFAFLLLNRDLMVQPLEIDLYFGNATLSPILLIAVLVVAFLIQILLGWVITRTLRQQTDSIERELAQAKAALYDRARGEKQEQEEPKAE